MRVRSLAWFPLALALAIPSTASAARTWLPASDLTEASTTSATYAPQIVADPSGNATAVWVHATNGGTFLEAASRPAATGVWSAPVPLGAGDAISADEQLAVDADGNVTAVWSVNAAEGGMRTVYAATLAGGPSGTWSATKTLATGYQPAVTDGRRGDAVATWQGTDGVIRTATRSGATGAWQDAVAVSTPGISSSYPSIASDDAGGVTVAWKDGSGVEVATRAAGGAWSAPVSAIASTDLQNGPAALAVNGAGDAILASVAGPNGPGGPGPGAAVYGIPAVSRPHGSARWSSPTSLTPGYQEVFRLRLAIDDAGDTAAIWSTINSANTGTQVETTRGSIAGPWEAPVTISGTDANATAARIAIDAAGNDVAIWTSQTPEVDIPDTQRSATRLASSATWGATTDLGQAYLDGMTPYGGSLGLDEQGNAFVAWQGGQGHAKITTAILDAAGPRISGVDVPASVPEDSSSTFGATANDAISGVGSTRWDFGDGTTADGATAYVKHTYPNPGKYTVSYTATDKLGNASTVTRPISVLATPATSPSTLRPAGPLLAAGLKGAVLTLNAKLAPKHTGKHASACPKTRSIVFRISTGAGKKATVYKLTSRAITVGRSGTACALTGSVVLKSAPPAGAKVAVRVQSPTTKTTTLTAARS